MSRINAAVFLSLLLVGVMAVGAQTSATVVKPSIISGDVTSIVPGKVVVNTKTGPVDAVLTSTTEYKRVAADKPSLSTATAAALTEISVGDRVMVTGILAADGKSLPARAVYLMTKSDIAQFHTKETEEWKTRGIAGKITAIDPQTQVMTVTISGLTGNTTVKVTPKSDAAVLHYAPDSVLFDEAKPSSLSEAHVGDFLRAIGEKGADGTTFTAEKILIGSFQTVAGTVKSVDVDKKEVVIKDLNTGKDVTVWTGDATTFKRFPPEMAERMASFQGGGGAARPIGSPTGQAGQAGGGASGGGMRPGGGRAGGLDDMLERFQTITTADLKPGDVIAVSSSKGATPDRIKAFKLLAGVEPFLRMAQTSGGRRSQGVNGNFTIPGLDGLGF